MRTMLPALILALSLPGCADAVGPGGDCRVEMREVQRMHGEPDRELHSDDDGERMTTWIYLTQSGEEGRVVTFRWGPRLDRCIVSTR